jgi:uncharacterized damage-inducible protein DinB
MSQPALTAEEVLAWLEATSTHWRALVESHPEALAFPCDIMGVSTVGGLLQHIVAVELRYAEQLAGLPPTGYDAIPFGSAAQIYATHARALTLFRELLASDVNWDERLDYVTRSRGPASSARKTVLFHALLHSIRHYAQLATLARQHGIQAAWPMDYIMMDFKTA